MEDWKPKRSSSTHVSSSKEIVSYKRPISGKFSKPKTGASMKEMYSISKHNNIEVTKPKHTNSFYDEIDTEEYRKERLKIKAKTTNDSSEFSIIYVILYD